MEQLSEWKLHLTEVLRGHRVKWRFGDSEIPLENITEGLVISSYLYTKDRISMIATPQEETKKK